MNLIVAVDKNWGIGVNGDQPFFIPEDLQYFKDKTLHKVVVMGRITLAALPGGRPLKNRTNIVISRDKNLTADGAIICGSLEELAECISQYDTDDVFIIGGQQIYEMLLNQCRTAYITKIFAASPADRFFPNLDNLNNWTLTEQSEIKTHDGINFQFCVYHNITITPNITL